MGNEQSVLEKNGYKPENEKVYPVIATKEDDKFLIKILDQKTINADPVLASEIDFLKTTSHPHIVSSSNSFQDRNTYVVMSYCQGGNLAAKVRGMNPPPQESEVLNWFVEICMALKTIHENDLVHNHLTPENIFLTEFGTVCLGDFGRIHEKSKLTHLNESNEEERLNYLAPEVLTEENYGAESDIWSVGCILHELCIGQPAFSAGTQRKLIRKIIRGPYPSLPEEFSPQLRELLSDIFNKDPQLRPTASEILGRPFIISCLTEKCKTTMGELWTKLKELRDLADALERVHAGATIGSLAGGVIGAVGGVTSIVGLILAPFTLGASLIVTGVGVGVGVAGGVTASASNITKMVNQSSDRRAVKNLIKEFEEKINAVVIWLQEIGDSLQLIVDLCDSDDTLDTKNIKLIQDNLSRLGWRAGRSAGGIFELVRLVQVMNIGKIAAQASRVVRVAEVATGVLSGLFIAVDIFFIAMDAKEIHHIRQAQAAGGIGKTCSESEAETVTSDKYALVPSSLMQEVRCDNSETQDKSSQNAAPIRSEIMKFVLSVRQAADNLQEVLNELDSTITFVPSLQDERALGYEEALM